jgi:hypothetical protein
MGGWGDRDFGRGAGGVRLGDAYGGVVVLPPRRMPAGPPRRGGRR